MKHKLDVKKVTPTIGAEIHGVDLRTPSDDDIAQINHALLESGVVFFREQFLNPEEHIALGRRFAGLVIHPYLPTEPGYPELFVVRNGPDKPNFERDYDTAWHADITNDLDPPMGALLLLREIPANGGGDTLWSSTNAAYDALSATMKAFVAGLTAIHGPSRYFKGDQEVQQSEHPVVRTHPVTGRQSLFVNSGFTKSIVQLEPHESDALLHMLYAHIASPRFHCRFKWEPGSIALWDNRCTQHRAIGDTDGYRRYGHRVTLCGEVPFYRPEGGGEARHSQVTAKAGQRV